VKDDGKGEKSKKDSKLENKFLVFRATVIKSWARDDECAPLPFPLKPMQNS